MPAEAMSSSSPSRAARWRSTPSAVGERQMLPVQTNRIARFSFMPSPIIRIRLARRGDAAAITAFNRAMALETEAKSLFPRVIGTGVRRLLARPPSGYDVVAERRAESIGALIITKECSNGRNGHDWWVQSVFVAPAQR